MEMVERSLPTFLRRKPIRLGGLTAGGGTVVLLFIVCDIGKGKRDFGLEGKAEVADSGVSLLLSTLAGPSRSLADPESSSSMASPLAFGSLSSSVS